MTRKTYVLEVVKFVFYDDHDNYKKIGSKFNIKNFEHKAYFNEKKKELRCT